MLVLTGLHPLQQHIQAQQLQQLQQRQQGIFPFIGPGTYSVIKGSTKSSGWFKYIFAELLNPTTLAKGPMEKNMGIAMKITKVIENPQIP